MKYIIPLLSLLFVIPPLHTAELTILFTHDLHSRLDPFKVIAENNQIKTVGGHARLATTIKNIKAQKQNVVIVDAGDFTIGSIHHMLFTKDPIELTLMGDMGFQFTTLGNHEFDFQGTSGLFKMFELASRDNRKLPIVIASNFIEGKDRLPKYAIHHSAGIKIGIIGLVGKDAAYVIAPWKPAPSFTNAIDTAKELVSFLKQKEKVDFVIALSHSGTNDKGSTSEDEELAKVVPDIDVIISGHTHTTLSKPLQHGKTIIGSAGNYGKNLGQINFDINGKNITYKNYQLLPIDDTIPYDENIKNKIDNHARNIFTQELSSYDIEQDKPVSSISYLMTPREELLAHSGEYGIGNVIADSFRDTASLLTGEYISVGLAVVGEIRDTFFPGEITTPDVFQILSLGAGPDGKAGYPLVYFYLTGTELKRILEMNTSIAKYKPSHYFQVSGIRIIENPYRVIFDRINHLEVLDKDGRYLPVENDRLYGVTTSYKVALMIEYLRTISTTIVDLEMKDISGNLISSIDDRIIYVKSPTGDKLEVKTWYALYKFIKDKKNEFWEQYQKPQGRITITPSLHPMALLKNATEFTYGFITLFILCTMALIFLIKKGLKRCQRTLGTLFDPKDAE